jgi:hypothetical protein
MKDKFQNAQRTHSPFPTHTHKAFKESKRDATLFVKGLVLSAYVKTALTSCGQSDALHSGACVALNGVEQMWVEIFRFF